MHLFTDSLIPFPLVTGQPHTVSKKKFVYVVFARLSLIKPNMHERHTYSPPTSREVGYFMEQCSKSAIVIQLKGYSALK